MLLLLASLLVSMPFAANAATLQSAPLNPAFVSMMQRQENGIMAMSPTGRPLGYRPSPLDLSHVKVLSHGSLAASTAVLPSRYDLREHNLVTAVHDQGQYGTCWAFGAFASLESTLKKESGTAHDFSEWHLAYFAYEDYSASLPAFSMYEIAPGEDPIFDQGGDIWKATAILARWTGAVSESERPYSSAKPWSESSRPLATDRVSNHLENAIYLPVPLDVDTVKNALMSQGAVTIAMEWDDAAYNYATASFFNPSGEWANHQVTIIGWDDNYPAANFITPPPINGAWLVKNSWGTGFGDAGYFWISYMEGSLCDAAVFFGASTTLFDKIYQYDPLGWTNSAGFSEGSDTAWFANIFNAIGSGSPTNAELLKAVSFYAGQTDSTYRIEVRTGVNAGNPASGTIANVTEGILGTVGYHTVSLSSNVALTQGELFSIIVRLTTPGYNFPIPIERPIPEYSDKARANAGESFASRDGVDWKDTTTIGGSSGNDNVCLKAFSSSGTTPTPSSAPDPAPTPRNGGGGCSVGAGTAMPAVLLLMIPLAVLLKGIVK